MQITKTQKRLPFIITQLYALRCEFELLEVTEFT